MKAVPAVLSLAVLLCAAGVRAADGEPKLLMARKGKPLFSDDLSQPPGNAWVGKPGRWEVVDGALQGAEVKADMHAAVRRHPMPFQNAVFQYDFRLMGARMTTLSINDAKGHVARVLLRPDGFTVQKDDHDHEGPDKAVVFQRKSLALEPGRWYTLVVEIVGPEIVAHIDDQVRFGSDPLIGGPKTNFGFTVSGEAAQFRNLRVWEALPDPGWEQTKQRLLAAKK